MFLIAIQEDLAKHTMRIKNSDQVLDSWWSDFNRVPTLRSNKIKNLILNNEGFNWGLLNLAFPEKSSLRLANIIDNDISDDSDLWWNEERKEHLYEQMSESHKLDLHKMLQGTSYSYGTVYRRMRKGRSMAELRTDGFAGCLRTPKGGSSKQIVIRAGENKWSVRLLTPREYARLQGVRESFKLPSNSNKGYFAMGDAVCVPVIEYIAENILDKVYEN